MTPVKVPFRVQSSMCPIHFPSLWLSIGVCLRMETERSELSIYSLRACPPGVYEQVKKGFCKFSCTWGLSKVGKPLGFRSVVRQYYRKRSPKSQIFQIGKVHLPIRNVQIDTSIYFSETRLLKTLYFYVIKFSIVSVRFPQYYRKRTDIEFQ